MSNTIPEIVHVEEFFHYANERYKIMLKKENGDPQPWTEDEILQNNRFCNIFREDDKVTKWIRKEITEEKYGEKLIGAMVIARWFNKIETLERLIEKDILLNWDMDLMRQTLKNVQPIVTGAYMIKTPAKMNKLEGLIWCFNKFLECDRFEEVRAPFYAYRLFKKEGFTLEEATKWLTHFPYLGPFMAYEVVTDLRHSLLKNAPDILTWANPGPGATRGIARICGLPLTHFDRNSKKDVEVMNKVMQKLLSFVNREDKLYWQYAPWEMREVEHTLCEFDKYTRAKTGEGRIKQKYRKGE